mmetsp:Transcript_650/g.1026  ORF Transcript_650/g.1026 Transcript_650/m.1026 type:complete len:407 (+) Transcript_650:77-1297(+)
MKSILSLVSALTCLVFARADEECANYSYTTVEVSSSTRIKYRSTSTTLDVIMESTEVAWLGLGWRGVGNAADGTSAMVGNKAVIGVLSALSPGTVNSIPKKYFLGDQQPSGTTLLPDEEQTLMNATFAANDGGGSSLSFTTNLIDGTQEIPAEGTARFIYAVGFDRYNLFGHILRGSVLLNLAPCADFTEVQEKRARDWKTKQKAHGFLAAIAFGLLMPLAVSSAVFRERLNFEIRGVKGWIYVHMILNVLAYSLLTAAFVIAVIARNDVNGKHFFKAHDKLGLAIFIFVSLQVISGFLRPHPPKKEADETSDDSPGQDAAVDGYDDGNGEMKPVPKSLARASWEIVHRITALAILGMVIYQLYSGLEAYKKFWNEIDAWYTVYYIWFALILLSVLLDWVKNIYNA